MGVEVGVALPDPGAGEGERESLKHQQVCITGITGVYNWYNGCV